MLDLLPDTTGLSPEEILTGQEEKLRLQTAISEALSPMEQLVMQYFLQGLDYHQIAEKMGKKPKAIDNALQRIKRKTIRLLQENQ